MRTLLTLSIALFATAASAQTYMGNLSSNPYLPKAPAQPAGTFTNPYGNSYTSPKLYDRAGNFRGNVNANPYDPNSIANPYGTYGSRYSPKSINNPYGVGSPYGLESPNNPYSSGLIIIK